MFHAKHLKKSIRTLIGIKINMMKLRIAIAITLIFLVTNIFAQEKTEYKTETSIPYYNEDIMKI